MTERVNDDDLRNALAVPLERMIEATMAGGLSVEQAISVLRRTLDDIEAVALEDDSSDEFDDDPLDDLDELDGGPLS